MIETIITIAFLMSLIASCAFILAAGLITHNLAHNIRRNIRSFRSDRRRTHSVTYHAGDSAESNAPYSWKRRSRRTAYRI